MRRNYWSETKLAKLIRNVDKPTVATHDDWKSWEKDARRQHPIRMWIAEDGFDLLQDIIMWPIDRLYDAKYYAVNRWVTQTHALIAKPKHIKRGQWVDLDCRILHCLFDSLVDFVEIEKAYLNARSSDGRSVYKWWQVGQWRTRTWRSSEEGLEHLRWEAGLTEDEWLDKEKKDASSKLTPQALAAQEIIDLYEWWTVTRPAREDPYEQSGWNGYCKHVDEKYGSVLAAKEYDDVYSAEQVREIHEALGDIEQQHLDEDTEMLIRLIKIRGHLWT